MKDLKKIAEAPPKPKPKPKPQPRARVEEKEYQSKMLGEVRERLKDCEIESD